MHDLNGFLMTFFPNLIIDYDSISPGVIFKSSNLARCQSVYPVHVFHGQAEWQIVTGLSLLPQPHANVVGIFYSKKICEVRTR